MNCCCHCCWGNHWCRPILQGDYHANNKIEKHKLPNRSDAIRVTDKSTHFWVFWSFGPRNKNQGVEPETHLVGTMGVKFTSFVIGLHIDVLLFEVSSKKDVRRSLEDLDTRKRTTRNDASAMAGFGAPCHCFRFRITNGAVRFGGAPKTEIYRGKMDQVRAIEDEGRRCSAAAVHMM